LNLAHKTDVRLPRESADTFRFWQSPSGFGNFSEWAEPVLPFVDLDGPWRKNGSVVNPRTILTTADWFFTVFQRASGLQRPNLHRSPVVGLSTAELPD
jgi:hypothetical protein